MNLYQSILYGNQFYGPSGTDIPQDLRFYRTNTDNVYVFHWGFDELFISPNLSTLDFELQIDFNTSFSTPDLKTFISTTAITYQNGDARKGYAIPMFPRLDKTEQTAFARVRTLDPNSSSASSWSRTLEFTILEKFQVEEAENLLNNLPDRHVYNKEDVLRPVTERNTLLYQFSEMYGSELDQTKLEAILTKTNLYLYLCRDEQLFDNFGTLFFYDKSQTQEFVEYRECIRALINGSLVGGTLDAIQRVVRCFTGVSPTIELVRDRDDFFLSTIFETPPETPDNVITFFSTSSDYINGSLVVLQNGSVLTPGADFTENHTTPGFDMTVVPAALDTLQVFFDIGDTGDPDPIVFDISDTTNLTGTVTFTNSSRDVTGVGTAFDTELQKGRLITDSAGIVLGEVKKITSATALELKQDWIGATGASSPAKVINFNGTIHIPGVVTFNNSSTAVTGVGSQFTLNLAVGDTITDDLGVDLGVVDTITDDDNLVLASNWAGSTGTNFNARKLIYSESILWDIGTLAHGLIIKILNPGQFILDEQIIEDLVRLILPAHVRSFFDFQ